MRHPFYHYQLHYSCVCTITHGHSCIYIILHIFYHSWTRTVVHNHSCDCIVTPFHVYVYTYTYTYTIVPSYFHV